MADVVSALPAGGRLLLDAGGLLAWAHGDPFTRGMILRAGQQQALVVVPVVVVAQVIRGGPSDARVNRILKGVEEFTPVTLALARQAGALLAATGTTDVVDALVVVEALRLLPAAILTSDPGDLRLLLQRDPSHARVRIIPV